MIQNKRLLFLLLLPFVVINACKKEKDLSLKDLPGSASLSIREASISNFKLKTIQAKKAATSITTNNLLGIINDPIFGEARLNFATEFSTTKTIILNDTAAVYTLDSVCLKMKYGIEVYGEGGGNTALNLTLTEPTKRLTDRDTFFSNTPFNDYFNASSNLLFNGTVDVSKDQKLLQILTINLNVSVMQKVFNKFKQGVQSIDDIPSIFNGICMYTNSASTTKGIVLQLEPLSAATNMIFYFKKTTNAVTTKDSLFLNVLQTSKKFHTISNNINILVQNAVSNTDSTISYIQTVGQFEADLYIPELGQWADSGSIAINNAELIIKPNYVSTDLLFPISKLDLFPYNNKRENFISIDLLNDPNGNSGVYDPIKNEYRFAMTSHIQQIAKGNTKNYGFALKARNTRDKFARTILNASNISFKLTYTKIK